MAKIKILMSSKISRVMPLKKFKPLNFLRKLCKKNGDWKRKNLKKCATLEICLEQPEMKERLRPS
jgi:hypothetical protein